MNKILDIKEIDDNYYIKLCAFIEVQDKYNFYEEEYHRLVKDYYELYDQLRDAKKQIKDINKANQNKSSIIKKLNLFLDKRIEECDNCLDKTNINYWHYNLLINKIDHILQGKDE